MNGYILHKGFFKSEKKTLRVHTTGTLKLNQEFRSNCMRNHTATHLLNACLKKIKGVTCQKSSKVTDQNLSFDVAVFGDKLKPDEIMAIDDEIRRIIDLDIQVKIKEVDYADLLNFDFVTYIPGETYPETGIRIVEVQTDNLISRFVCCLFSNYVLISTNSNLISSLLINNCFNNEYIRLSSILARCLP